ncbi:3-deoxy-D-manno-octulosonic-acid transferase [Aliiroseovarius halocynthiae]|uniref:3-deoxy-D-manno-octulosonic acid transferase n=1 Tax=Aliiroseovarius halocynthiae TaxID=985055 RepID=A0A545SP66_9RHOB|nr:glycosyltransferase N-terminal domain-containing protein [Aliiroseovarius halocynthiae]TQV66656.1 hypothetical protein FIL88_13100 [Aliiroseovarius halocynthiae]SMR82467.1 3-deoxy-D-manno-octulosonic-acid transferase [Aliiroseovarius halocynthiae]
MSRIGLSLLRRLQALQGKTFADSADSELSKTPVAKRESTPDQRPEGLLIWGCLSEPAEGEALSSLMPQLRAEMGELTLLLTSPNAQQGASFSDDLYLPNPKFDPASIRGFLEHWRPDVVVWMRSEVDLTVFEALNRQGIPIVWIGATPPQDRGLTQRLKQAALRDIIIEIDTILPQDGASRRELLRLGVAQDKMQITGVLEPHIQVPKCDIEERDQIAQKLDGRPVWLAVGVDPREEGAILSAHRTLIRKSHRLLLVLIPEDPGRTTDLVHELEKDTWITSTRFVDRHPHRDDQIFVVDRTDECGLWMHLASITWIGGTMAGGANRNPLNPAALGSVVIYGTEGGRHEASLERLTQAGAARKVQDAASLATEVEQLLAPDKAAEMAMAAWDVTTKGAEVSEHLMERLLDLLDEAESRKGL